MRDAIAPTTRKRARLTHPRQIVVYYWKSTAQYHVYQNKPEGIIGYYMPREWCDDPTLTGTQAPQAIALTTRQHH